MIFRRSEIADYYETETLLLAREQSAPAPMKGRPRKKSVGAGDPLRSRERAIVSQVCKRENVTALYWFEQMRSYLKLGLSLETVCVLLAQSGVVLSEN